MLLNRFVKLCLVSAVALAIGGCSDAVSHSETVSLKLGGMKEGDLKENKLSEEKNVNSESGNPYGVFIKNAKAQLDGRDPGQVAPVSAFLRMHSDTTGVTGFEEVFTSMELFFSNSATTIPVGTVASPSGTSVEVVLTDTNLEALHASMVSGDFKVGVRGPATIAPPNKFDLRITVDIKFEAFE